MNAKTLADHRKLALELLQTSSFNPSLLIRAAKAVAELCDEVERRQKGLVHIINFTPFSGGRITSKVLEPLHKLFYEINLFSRKEKQEDG